MGDFLKKDVETPLCGCYVAAGVRLRIETNSESILAIARANLEPSDAAHDPEEVRLKLWVEDEQFPHRETKPYFRGLGHLVFSGYDDRSSLLMDLRNRCGAGRFTQTLARNPAYWKTALFPSLLGIVGPSVGLTSLHSACVSWKGSGLLLAGGAGAGKSTLSLALAQAGMDFLSDDRTLVRDNKGKLVAWGLSREMKQRTDAIVHFPALQDAQAQDARCEVLWKGEPAFRFDPVQLLGVTRAESCEPSWIVFLERQPAPIFQMEEITPNEAAILLQRDLHQEMPDASERQRLTIRMLSQKSCYRLRYGGNPHTVAGGLRQLFMNRGSSAAGVQRPRDTYTGSKSFLSSDPLRRFRVTSLRSDVLLMGRHLRIETDSPVVLKRIAETFNTTKVTPRGSPQFLWRIACEPRQESCSSWPSMTAFCKGSLRYINLGQFSFVAADLDAREAVGVLPESLCEDEIGFPTVFLASLLHLTAPALGLTAISAACVAKRGNGLLLFGPPNSGKTTASYWGKKLGLEFHADQATFLEHDGGAVYAWGEFWPAAFRPETVQFIPELGDRTSLPLSRSIIPVCGQGGISRGEPGRVTPAACIFLERHAASPPKLVPLPRWEIPGQIFTDAGSEEDRNAIRALLGKVPAYRLLYDDDPSIAARFFRSVLDAHQLMEQRT